MELTLTIIGIGLEVGGALLTFSPELVPRFRRGSAYLQRQWSRLLVRVTAAVLRSRIGQLLRRPKVHVKTGTLAAGGVTMGGGASGYASPAEDASLERQVSFLLDQVRHLQQKLDAVQARQGQHTDEWRRDIEEARSALGDFVALELQKARDLFIVRRLVGLALIVTGSVLLGVANLL